MESEHKYSGSEKRKRELFNPASMQKLPRRIRDMFLKHVYVYDYSNPFMFAREKVTEAEIIAILQWLEESESPGKYFSFWDNDGFSCEALACLGSSKLIAGLSIENDNKLILPGIEALAQGLAQNSVIQQLRFKQVELAPAGWIIIADALAKNRSLRSFEIRQRDLDLDFAKALARALMVNNTLEEVRLSYCDLSADSMLVIAQALQKNSCLKVFYSQFNEVNVREVAAFAQCQHIQMLNLSTYFVRDEKNNEEFLSEDDDEKLRERLSSSNLGPSEHLAFISMPFYVMKRLLDAPRVVNDPYISLSQNKSLYSLDLTGHILSPKALESFAANTTLTTLVLDRCFSYVDEGLVNNYSAWRFYFGISPLKILAANQTLQNLSLEANGLNSLDLRYLLQMRALTKLNISKNRINGNDIEMLAKHPNLNHLVAEYCMFRFVDYQFLRRNKTLTMLNIGGNSLGLAKNFDGIKHNPRFGS